MPLAQIILKIHPKSLNWLTTLLHQYSISVFSHKSNSIATLNAREAQYEAQRSALKKRIDALKKAQKDQIKTEQATGYNRKTVDRQRKNSLKNILTRKSTITSKFSPTAQKIQLSKKKVNFIEVSGVSQDEKFRIKMGIKTSLASPNLYNLGLKNIR